MTEAWRRLQVPEICERMIGFSVPQDDTVLVVSYEGTHLVRLGQTVTVETDTRYSEYDLYDPDTAVCRYRRKEWQIIGIRPGRPILTARDGAQLVLNEMCQTISVTKGAEEVWSSAFKNASGDWAAATFSSNGRFIVLGCPYGFDFRVWESTAPAEPSDAPKRRGFWSFLGW